MSERHLILPIILIIVAAMLWACAPSPTPAAPALPAAPSNNPTSASSGNFVLASSAFSEGGSIPKKYTCDGEGVSLPLKWSGTPSNSKSLVLIVDDPDAPSGTFTHWVAFDLPASQNELAEGAKGAGQAGLNGRGQPGYTGPCPPSGTHRYVFTLYALDIASLGLPGASARADVEKAMQGHIIAKTQLMGRYGR